MHITSQGYVKELHEEISRLNRNARALHARRGAVEKDLERLAAKLQSQLASVQTSQAATSSATPASHLSPRRAAAPAETAGPANAFVTPSVKGVANTNSNVGGCFYDNADPAPTQLGTSLAVDEAPVRTSAHAPPKALVNGAVLPPPRQLLAAGSEFSLLCDGNRHRAETLTQLCVTACVTASSLPSHIATAAPHLHVLAGSGQLRAWGEGARGQLGISLPEMKSLSISHEISASPSSPPAPPTTAVAVAVRVALVGTLPKDGGAATQASTAVT